MRPGKMRGERQRWRDMTILNDCYNSNPDAARYMIDVLRDEPAERRIAVLGEMLELGQWAEPLHRDVGEYAAKSGIDVVIGIHGAAQSLVEAAAKAGVREAHYFDASEEAGSFLREFAAAGDAVLFKGSRGTHVERALSAYGCVSNALLALRSGTASLHPGIPVIRLHHDTGRAREPDGACDVPAAWAMDDSQIAGAVSSGSISARRARSRTRRRQVRQRWAAC